MPAKRERRLFFEVEEPGSELPGARLLPLDLIDPNPTQSRQVFDEAALGELANSIQQHGVLEPILVYPQADRYLVIAGERRTRAARIAGLTDIPALIREDLTEAQAAIITALENLQREDLDAEDEARWFAYLQGVTGLSDRALAEQLGKHRNYVNRRLRMLREAPALFARIRAGELTQRQALLLLDQGDTTPVSHRGTLTTEAHGEEVSHGGTLTSSDSREEEVPHGGTPIERATLDHRTGAVRGGDLQRTPWRDRPLQGFMDWVARVDVTTVPLEERAAKREQIVELREWLTRLELQLLPPESDEAI